MPRDLRHPCPCCGHRTFLQAPPGTWETCPVCFWEDPPTTGDPREANGVTLVEGQRNYARLGASAERWRGEVRRPTAEEARTLDWKTIDERRPIVARALEEVIEAAFGEVRREGGVTLHQTHVLDDYGDGAAMAAAAARDPEARWQDIAEEKLVALDGAAPFFDPAGFRFYAPAYLRLYARHLASNDGGVPSPGLFWHSLSGSEYHQRAHYALLDAAQRGAIARFLDAVVEVGAADEAREAAGFLEYWGQFRE